MATQSPSSKMTSPVFNPTPASSRRGLWFVVGFFLLGGFFSAATMAMRWQTRLIEAPGEVGRIQARNRTAEHELDVLNQNLDQMVKSLQETHAVMLDARDLVGLEPGPRNWNLQHPADEFPAPNPEGFLSGLLTGSACRIDETLLQARQLRRSFAEIVASMERDADA